MMARVVWTPTAEQELDNLFYIRMDDGRPLTARRIGEDFNEVVARQALQPRAGKSHIAAPAGWLYVKVKRWLIFYRPISDGIEVMRVIDAVRDLPKLLGG